MAPVEWAHRVLMTNPGADDVRRLRRLGEQPGHSKPSQAGGWESPADVEASAEVRPASGGQCGNNGGVGRFATSRL